VSAVLDASAVAAILRGEPGAIAAADAAVSGAITSVNLAEARDRLGRLTGDPPSVARALDALVERGMRVLVCDRELAEAAADLRTRHYHRRRAAVSLADCIAVAAAERAGGPLVSSDHGQVALARTIGVAVRPIANSSGLVPEG
jgi:PIN domain nuclease of toxin-antitoxin system